MARWHRWIVGVALVVLAAPGAGPAAASPTDVVGDDVPVTEGDDAVDAVDGVTGTVDEDVSGLTDGTLDITTGVERPTLPQPTGGTSGGSEPPPTSVADAEAERPSSETSGPPPAEPTPREVDRPAQGRTNPAPTPAVDPAPPRGLVRSIGQSATAFRVPVVLLAAIGLAAVFHARLAPADRRLLTARIDRDLRRFE